MRDIKVKVHPSKSNLKKKRSDFIIYNNFTKKHVNECIKKILNEIL